MKQKSNNNGLCMPQTEKREFTFNKINSNEKMCAYPNMYGTAEGRAKNIQHCNFQSKTGSENGRITWHTAKHM